MSTSPSTTVRAAIKQALEAEFAFEGIVFKDDKLHPAMGTDGPVGGLYPDVEDTRPGRRIELQTVVFVQLFAKWEKVIDPAQEVSPTLIEGWAARLRDALKPAQQPSTGDTWYFYVTTVQYLDDPTGNRSRLLARVQAHGGNPNLVETGP
jgi:hypothetical protein